MMKHKYSIEKNVQLIVALMKAHGIKRVVASPGSTNVCLSHSLQNDPFFKMYSSVDERSAAYLACGLASETGEPVALTCTEATASRNYMSGLTEAYYRHLPILCITATNDITCLRQNHPQMIDRSSLPNDIVCKSVFIPTITDAKKERGYANILNDAMLELYRRGGSPVHIEYETCYSNDYSVEELPKVNVTRRITVFDDKPELPVGRVAIYVGSHKRWNPQLTDAVDEFCEKYDGVVLCDHISNYQGKYGVFYTLLTSQEKFFSCASPNTVIYIGDISSAYPKNLRFSDVWRVSLDGELRDVLRKYGGSLKYVFETDELEFFRTYNLMQTSQSTSSYYEEWRQSLQYLEKNIPSLPYSNLWVAQQTAHKIPQGSFLYLAIENTLRTWNFFPKDISVFGCSNTGGFGIDGGVSALIGASFANPNRLYFGVTGDLAFFYDMNVLGNRHVQNNVRLMVINNGIGQQFKNPKHPAIFLGGAENEFVAAAGHFGNKSETLLKHYAQDLGYTYLQARNKEEFIENIGLWCSQELSEKSIVFEVFTNTQDETEALRSISSIEVSVSSSLKQGVRAILGEGVINAIKKI